MRVKEILSTAVVCSLILAGLLACEPESSQQNRLDEDVDRYAGMSAEEQMLSAVSHGDLGKMRSLLNAGLDPDNPSMLARLICRRDGPVHEMMELLFEYGANPNGNGKDNPLSKLASCYNSGRTARLKYFLSKGASIDGDGVNVPLITAFKGAARNNDDMATFGIALLRMGASTEIMDWEGNTPLSVLGSRRHPINIGIIGLRHDSPALKARMAESKTFRKRKICRDVLYEHRAIERKKREQQKADNEGPSIDLGPLSETNRIASRIAFFEGQIERLRLLGVWAPERVDRQLQRVRDEFEGYQLSAEFAQQRSRLIEHASRDSGLAGKILLRTVSKSTDDRRELVLDVARATLSGGGTVVSTIGLNAVEASLEVLSEEGVLTSEEKIRLEATYKVIKAINDASDAESALETLAALRDGYRGAVELGIINEEGMDHDLKVTIGAGSEVVDVLVLLQ